MGGPVRARPSEGAATPGRPEVGSTATAPGGGPGRRSGCRRALRFDRRQPASGPIPDRGPPPAAHASSSWARSMPARGCSHPAPRTYEAPPSSVTRWLRSVMPPSSGSTVRTRPDPPGPGRPARRGSTHGGRLGSASMARSSSGVPGSSAGRLPLSRRTEPVPRTRGRWGMSRRHRHVVEAGPGDQAELGQQEVDADEEDPPPPRSSPITSFHRPRSTAPARSSSPCRSRRNTGMM